MDPHAVFENQGLLVVNGTNGIAPGVILRAAGHKAKILFTVPRGCERDAEQLMAKATEAGLSDRLAYVTADLKDEQAVEQLVDTAVERLPSLDVLIHNLESEAVREPKSLVDIELEEWNGVLAKEVRTPFWLARRMVEEFLFAQAPGRIVYIGYSDDGKALLPASYLTAHRGLYALVRCMTKEYGRREVGCNAVIAPSRNRNGEPNHPELIETVLFLASRESSFVNGEFLHVDGELRE